MCTHPAAIFRCGVEVLESGETRDGTLALAKLVGPRGKRDLFVAISVRHDHLRNCCSLSRSCRNSAHYSAASLALPIAESGCPACACGLGILGSGRGARHCVDFYRHAEPSEAVALRAHRSLRGWLSVRLHRMAEFPRLAGNHIGAARFPVCRAASSNRGDCGSYVVVA